MADPARGSQTPAAPSPLHWDQLHCFLRVAEQVDNEAPGISRRAQTSMELHLAPAFPGPWRLPPFPWEGVAGGFPFLPGDQPCSLHPSPSCLQAVSLPAAESAHQRNPSQHGGWSFQESQGQLPKGPWSQHRQEKMGRARHLARAWPPSLPGLTPRAGAKPAFCL